MMYQKICTLHDLLPELGVSALVNGEQVAIFRLKDDRVFAVSNYDHFSQANIISRGLTGNLKGFDVVASPMYKQHFVLETGACLEDEQVTLKTYAVKIDGDDVLIAA